MTDLEIKKEDQYEITIQATVTKTIKVIAPTEELAIEQAHSEFTVAPEEGEDERYEEETISVKKMA